jgi:hypothetical protein
MISDNEFNETVRGLYEKTSKENIAWMQKHPPDGTFWLQVPGAVITIQHVRPTAEPDYITFVLARSLQGPVLATRKVYDGDQGWDLLQDLYALVSRKASGWENVWKDVQKFLGKPTSAVAS